MKRVAWGRWVLAGYFLIGLPFCGLAACCARH